MSEDYNHRRASTARRAFTISSDVIPEPEEIINHRRLSCSINAERRLSTVAQIYLPRGNEYYPQERVPPTGPESQQRFILTSIETDPTTGQQRRLSIVTEVNEQSDDQYQGYQLSEKSRRILFLTEPIIGAFILFPIIVLFSECGWNLVEILLNYFNKFKQNLHSHHIIDDDSQLYKWQLLVYPYLIVQFILLVYYLGQDLIYNFLKNRKWIIKTVLLKFHIFVLATIYTIQWVMIWTIWDQFVSHEWYFELTLSTTAIFALIVFNGHLSDLVCSPFLFSYDSIEYCIHFGCPLLTKDMKQWKINLINFILYEIIISNLSIISWRGIYHFLDVYLYPDDLNISAGICLVIGYLLYFPLMYFQRYLEELNLKYEFWAFVSINFPQFYRNIRHLLAFLSCVFAWRGYWELYDSYIYIFDDYYKTYLLLYLLSFVVLGIAQTCSSINGPLNNIEEKNNFFPLYPHCYVSIVQRKLWEFFFSKSPIQQNNNER